MKKQLTTVLFAASVVCIVALAIFLGWHLGPRADMEELRNLRSLNLRMQEDLALARCHGLNDLFATVVDIQKSNSDPSIVRHLNSLIDAQIANPLYPLSDSPYDVYWNRIVLSIADYRTSHPVGYEDPEEESWMQELFDRARKHMEKTSNKSQEGIAEELGKPSE